MRFLRRLVQRLNQLQPSRSVELLRGRILQERAQRYWSDLLDDHDQFIEFSQQSLAIKRSHHDVQGVALSLGLMGKAYYYEAVRKQEAEESGAAEDCERALELSNESLELEQEMGRVNETISLYNIMGMARWRQLQTEKDSKDQTPRRRAAISDCVKSMDLARQAKRTGDLVFAANSVLEFALVLSDHEYIKAAFSALLDEELKPYKDVRSGYPKKSI